ncbi:MAG: phosphoribosylformylglycinamidine synthase subunit PurL, partial [Candidatus Cloacimonetes bacterium]|nr:phosphoribosylformylglycinamidine synthase subunit PurL [Candidatus Cloacimonadota bacterium]
AVQVGDPFYEKLLLEATLEIIKAGLVVGIQDMGAAGLTCSSSEMSGKGGVGIEIDVNKVPQRESGMSTYEIMLSESQERMLVIVEPQNIDRVLEIFGKWDLDAVQIGSITEDKILRVKSGDMIEAEIPAEYLILGGKAPVYKRETKRPEYLDDVQNQDTENLECPISPTQVLMDLLSSPNIASKHNIFRQYDHMVGIGTSVEPGSDAAVIRIRDTDKAIAAATDCNGRYCYLNPYEGTKAAVAESARNVACSGAKPIAITNCLNFGNPYKPEVYYSFSECIRGMKDACVAFDTPVTGGNVSFYNENPNAAIYPTPVIGMLGLMKDFKKAITQHFKQAGDKIFLLGNVEKRLAGSEYLKVVHNKVCGRIAPIDLNEEKRLQECVLELIDLEMLHSAHDLSDGGLAIALAESCFHPEKSFGIKASFTLSQSPITAYFGESGANIIVSLDDKYEHDLHRISQKHGIHCMSLGEVTSSEAFIINDDIKMCVLSMREAYENGLKI